MPSRLIVAAITVIALGLMVSRNAPTADAATCTIGVGAAQTGAATDTTTPLTIASYDPGTGANRLLVVGVSLSGGSTVSSITFNSTGVQPLTLAGVTNNGTQARSEIWFLVNPNSGPGTVTVNFANTAVGRAEVAAAITFTGVDQANPVD